LAERLGLEIRIAHYPPYCSKHNSIEHRLFPHQARACQGVIFHTADIAEQAMEKAKTATGLKVSATILSGVYETKREQSVPRILSKIGASSSMNIFHAGISSRPVISAS